MHKKALHAIIFVLLITLVLHSGQNRITSPKEHLGFRIGEDYHLANYTQLVSYWKKLEQQTDRMKLVEIGKTAEGRPMVMAVITSPQNHSNLDRYKAISKRLALAEGLADTEARSLAAEGKAVVWIDGGLHGTEVLGAQQLFELVYRMVSRDDNETLRILEDVILLTLCTNPDGMELVSDWYMRREDPSKRTTRGLPRLYQKYVGHDNNRDFYMSTQPETEAVNRILYRGWFPQIVYNHHQSGPAGTVLFAPPFRDPFNYYYDPLIPLEIEQVGAAMHNRFAAENKPGATKRSGARYSIWWNGGLRTTVYFHNIVGILTETIGNPTPVDIPFLPGKLLPSNDLPFPVAPQKWHFRQSVEYSITADMAVLDTASKNKKDFLFNIYLMGKNSIAKGNTDTWTIRPNLVEEVKAEIKKDKAEMVGEGRYKGYPLKYYEMFHDPFKRDPRGYIIPSDQADFLTAVKFINTLIKNGIAVHRAEKKFSVEGKTYPPGSFVIKTAQAFRPHLITMFEPQNYPDNLLYPGGPPIPTYDNAGWTLAFQMGIEFDRILEGFDGPFRKIGDLAIPGSGTVKNPENASGFLLSHEINDSFVAINRLLGKEEEITWLLEPLKTGKKNYPAGTFYIASRTNTLSRLKTLATEIGLDFEGTTLKPTGNNLEIRPVRIGLWDEYGGSMSSGWIRWLLEKYEFPFEVVYPPRLDAGDLNSLFDVLIFPNGAIPDIEADEETERRPRPEIKAEEIPDEYRDRLGKITVEKTIPQLLQFLDRGGTIICIGKSISLGYHAGLPVENALIEVLPDGSKKPLPREKYFVPGSILQTAVDNTNPVAHGLPNRLDVMFKRSPVLRLKPEAALQGIHPVAWFDNDKPLRSGWAWGQHYLQGGVAAVSARRGKGSLFLFGPEITFRAQPHGTFKFLFNGIYLGSQRRR